MDQSLDVSIVWHHFWGVTFVGGQTSIQAKAEAVTAENKIGKFDILPGHANLISVVYNSLIVQTAAQGTRTYSFQKGVVEVNDNKVSFFLESSPDQLRQGFVRQPSSETV